MSDAERDLTLAEAAMYLGLTYTGAHHLVLTGALVPCRRFGNCLVFTHSEVERVLAERGGPGRRWRGGARPGAVQP